MITQNNSNNNQSCGIKSVLIQVKKIQTPTLTPQVLLDPREALIMMKLFFCCLNKNVY